MSRKIITGAVLCGAILIGANASAFAKPPQTKNAVQQTKTDNTKSSYHKSKPSVTEKQAQAIALKKFPGTVESSKTDTYKGKEVYLFEIEGKKGVETNVWVDMTGKIIKSEKEKPKKDQNKSKTMKQKSKS
jgi:uncharacterized membrane protein YkoI